MLENNTILIYGSLGLCKVVDKCTKKFGDENNEYYILKPVNDERSTIYVPADNEELIKKIRKVLTEAEVYDLIRDMPNEETIWINDDRARNDNFKHILDNGDRKDLIKIIKTLYSRKKELSASGKKLRAADEEAMLRAENMLYDEFALVLNIKRTEVVDFILNHIDNE